MKKRAAMELSMSTIVILVLAMSMLILGLVLVKNIFGTAQSAISGIDKGVRNAITEMFADPDKKMAIYPSDRKISIKQRTQGEGFAFSIRNTDIQEATFKYEVESDPDFDIKKKCNIDKKTADSWLLMNSGTIKLPSSSMMENPELVIFNIPEYAPACTIPYTVTVKYGSGSAGTGLYVSGTIYLTIVSR